MLSVNISQNCPGHPGPIPDVVFVLVACSVERATFCDAPKQLPVVECEILCNSVVTVCPLLAADVHLFDCALCAPVLSFLKEGKTCQGERPASTADDTLDKYLIALQQKNR